MAIYTSSFKAFMTDYSIYSSYNEYDGSKSLF